MVLKQPEVLNTRKKGWMGPNLLGLDGLAGRLGVLGVAAGDLGDGGHHNLGALNLTLDQARLLGDGGWLDLLDWVAHLGDLVDAVVVGEDSRDGTNKDLGVGLPLAIVDTSVTSALSSGDVLADVLGDDLVAGHLNILALGDRLGHAGLSLHLLKLGLADGGVAGVEEGVGLRGGHGSGEAGKEENLEHDEAVL